MPLSTLGKRRPIVACTTSMWGGSVCPTLAPVSSDDYATWPGVSIFGGEGVIPYAWSGDYVSVFGRSLIDAHRAWVARGNVDHFEYGDFAPGPAGPIAWQVKQLLLCGTPRARAAVERGGACLAGEVTPAELAKAAAEAGRTIAKVVALVAPFIGIIPGIGQGIAMALTVASSLALGKPIGEAILSTIANAIPGGGVAKLAFEAAGTFGKDLAEGRDVGDSALDAARAAAKSEGGELAAAAFDAGVALARGKALQDAGFAALHAWVQGNDLAERSIAFAERVTLAAERGESVRDFMVDEARDALSHYVREDVVPAVSRAIASFVDDPDSRLRPLAELADKLGVAADAVQAAIMAVRDDGSVDGPTLRRLLSMVDPNAEIQGESRYAGRYVELAAARPNFSTVPVLGQARLSPQIARALAMAGEAVIVPSEERSPPELSQLEEQSSGTAAAVVVAVGVVGAVCVLLFVGGDKR